MAKYNIAIIGPEAVITGFSALGVTPFDAENGEQALAHLQSIKQMIDERGSDGSTFASVIIIESIAEQIAPEDMEKITRDALPAIVVLPGIEGSKGSGLAKLKSLAERAVGSDILS